MSRDFSQATTKVKSKQKAVTGASVGDDKKCRKGKRTGFVVPEELDDVLHLRQVRLVVFALVVAVLSQPWCLRALWSRGQTSV